MDRIWAAFYPGELMELWDILYGYREEICKTVVVGAGGVLTLTLGPAILALIGFGPGGIIGGSLAAKLMSLAATGYLPACLVSFLQSVGAGGSAGATTTVGGAIGWMISAICNKNATAGGGA